MGISTHIKGYRKADDTWKKMKHIWDVCREQRIEPPEAVLQFFDYEYPGDAPGKEVDIEPSVEEWGDETSSGFEVDLTKLPDGVKFLRFYQSC